MEAKRMAGRMPWIVAALLIMGAAADTAHAGRGGVVHLRQRLSPTGVDRNARGKVVLTVRPRTRRMDSTFDVSVHALDTNAGFDVMIDGIRVGRLTTNRGGKGHLRLASHPRGSALVLGVDPRGRDIVVRDGHGDDVLTGHCDEDAKHAGEVACCFGDSSMGAFLADERGDGDGEQGDDDHEGECRYLTPDSCVQKGGVVAGDSCAADPCETVVPPGDTMRCCVPEKDDDDGEGAECERTTPERCAANGGTMISATSCEPNPCEPTPPAVQPTRCCARDEDGKVECEHRTPAECIAHQGVDVGPGSCDADPCMPVGGGDGGTR